MALNVLSNHLEDGGENSHELSAAHEAKITFVFMSAFADYGRNTFFFKEKNQIIIKFVSNNEDMCALFQRNASH